jgi:hypothetical protein
MLSGWAAFFLVGMETGETLLIVSCDLVWSNNPIPGAGPASDFTDLLAVSATIIIPGNTERCSVSYGRSGLRSHASSEF